ADQLQLTAVPSSSVASGTVQLTIGSDFPVNDYLDSDGTPIYVAPAAETPTPAPVDTVDATATGAEAPAPTDLTKMTGTDIPCVR
ncbi:MAG: LytR family transcriptional regulator, partial [Mycobacterium sp.]